METIDDPEATNPEPQAAEVDGRPKSGAEASHPAPVERRRFLESVSREAVLGAAQAAGFALGLRSRMTAGIVEAIRPSTAGLSTPGPETPVAPMEPDGVAAADGAAAAGAAAAAMHVSQPPAHRLQPLRVTDSELFLVDQSGFPEHVGVRCRSVQDVAAALRDFGPGAAPLLGVVAAYGMWLGATEALVLPPESREQVIQGARQLLLGSRSDLPTVTASVERMAAALADLEPESGEDLGTTARRLADDVARDATDDLRRLARLAGDALAPSGQIPYAVLTMGSVGSFSGGSSGTVQAILGGLAARGRAVDAWVLETRPSLLGGRLTAWDLKQAGIPHTVVPDAAAGWLLGAGRIDAVVVAAESVDPGGGVTAVLGTSTLAHLARLHRVPFYVAAPLATVAAAGEGPAGEDPPAEDPARGPDQASGTHRVEVPTTDVTPAGLIDGFLTERGLLRPPFREALAAQLS